jgi:hypothetical protein
LAATKPIPTPPPAPAPRQAAKSGMSPAIMIGAAVVVVVLAALYFIVG